MQGEVIEANLDPVPTQTVHRPGFSSFKTTFPIPYAARWHRDLLIQLTLYPAVDTIEHERTAMGDEDLLNLRLIAAGTAIQVTALRDAEGVPHRPEPSDRVFLRRSVVLMEPRVSDARAVWATRRLTVQVGDRLRILSVVGDWRPHSIFDLVQSVHDRANDPFEIILSLVCRGDLAIDLRDGLRPETCVVKSKRRADLRPTA
ncbi:hypothetical protein [Methylobacterium sp. OT2]|uniref:hypothetical protein n=1 Tax=Methylobacterium sp. OT2 TaxID=2813779 RepID=UPI00197B679E|nr:hypothetical protein [Methylobacterium sp. OT2]MBN4096047.1 hypothetical protein [Methylobacterium sp. OT2]